MDIGELRDYPDYTKLVNGISNEVDKAVKDVVTASHKKSIEEIRFLSGRLEALSWVYRELESKKRSK